ncbi:hypothetical protein FNJ84_16840 [Paracoccus sp. M683]|uniref:hypothetical protein n=1 Tax=Paracoccus sp. M683 TaxID=2594268 RepID=UPI00117CA42C|nr:hypothetical protein [Paracoccus sp. M683]TRW95167.1 hypothetical protein FNJ84_16840 [Paracoccus sp. M683]
MQPFRRRVLYIPGYDPIPPRRYRELYRREGVAQAAISGYRLTMGARRDRTGFGWGAAGEFPQGSGQAEIEVLVWADIVQGSMGHGIAATYGQLARTAWAYIGSGALFRLMRLRRGPVIAALYPIVVLILQLLAALLAGWLAGWLVSLIAGWWLGLPVMAAVTWAGLVGWRRLDGRIFAYYLMHDYAFTAQSGGAYPPALETRIAQFTDRIAEVLAGDWDEVLIIGHSSGAYLAVSVLADLIRAGRVPVDGPALSLMTLGHVVPMASFLPRAQRLRRDLACLSTRDQIFWLDVTAPGDACSFGLCDPVAVTGVAPADQRWPLVISAAFTRTLSPEKQRELRGHWFRLHFQYLCAFDRPGDYDYFAITAGPLTLAQRFHDRPHSPGRITTPAGPGLARAGSPA